MRNEGIATMGILDFARAARILGQRLVSDSTVEEIISLYREESSIFNGWMENMFRFIMRRHRPKRTE